MTWKLPYLTALAVLLTLSALAPLRAASAVDDVLVTVEDEPLDFTLAELTANDPGAPEADILSVSQPLHGGLECSDAGCHYHPPPSFVGVDRFSYTFGEGTSDPDTAQVRIQVVPLIQPLAGDWNGDGRTDLGWFHGRFLDFFYIEMWDLETNSRVPRGAFSCDRPPVPAGRSGWIPFAGDWDGDGRSEIGLFYPPTREYVLYDRGQFAGGWVVAEIFTHPVPGQGGLPIAGDWDGQGPDTVGLFLPEDRRYLLLRENAGDAEVDEVTLTDLPDGPWLPVAGDWGGDGSGEDQVAAWNTATRVLRLRDDNSTGPTTEGEDYTQEDRGLLPFSGSWGHQVSIGFYDPGTGPRGRLEFVLYPCDYNPDCQELTGGRQPILLPPPEDPIITSCPAGQG